MKKVKLFDLDFISSDNLDEIVNDVFSRLDSPSNHLPLLITPNVDQIVKFKRIENHDLFNLFKQAKYILPDGQPIVTLSKLKFGRNGLIKRLTGADLFIKFWKKLLKTENKILLIVPTEEVGEKLKGEYENAKYYCPPFFDINDHETFNKVIDDLRFELNSFNPEFIVIGLGFPKQERIFVKLLEGEEQYQIPFTLLLGASFEFYLGIKKRAPKIMQKLGLEFLYRFISEPKRMFKRYFIDDSKFILLAAKELKKN